MTVKALREAVWQISSSIATGKRQEALRQIAAVRKRIKRALRKEHELSWLLNWADEDLRNAARWLNEGDERIALMHLQLVTRTIWAHNADLLN